MHSNSIPRRRHSAEFKAEVLAACEPARRVGFGGGAGAWSEHQPRAQVAHGPRRQARRRCGAGGRPDECSSTAACRARGGCAVRADRDVQARAGNIAAVRTHRSEAVIHVELKRGASSVLVRWPGSAAGDCAAWLRELSTALLK